MLIVFGSGKAAAQTTYEHKSVVAGQAVSWTTGVDGGHAIFFNPNPLKGSASWAPYVVTYNAGADASGEDAFTLQVRLCSDELCEYPYMTYHRFTVTVIPAPPSVEQVTATTLYGQSVTFSPVTQRATSLEIVSQPAGGSATASNLSLTYTPAPGFYGSDSFTFSAEGPGGASATATASITVEPPPMPSLVGGTIALAFNTAGSLNLSPTNGGVLEVSLAPVNGVVTVSGDTVTYAPSTDFIGTETFQVLARNIAGASAPVEVVVTVAPPPIPSIQGGALVLEFNASGEHEFSPTNGGIIEVETVPGHGEVAVAGGRAIYTPTRDYIGADTFSVVARNLGGVSAPAIVTVTVRPPPIPQLTGGSLALAFNQVGEHDFAPTNDGVLSLSSVPANGKVTFAGGRAIYQPDPDFIGVDQFSVVGVNLGGSSPPATVNVTVSPPPPPVAANSTMVVAYGQAMAADLAVTGRFSSVVITDAPRHGAVDLVGRRATYVPAAGYFGEDSFSFEASGLGGVSGVATVAVTVERPDVPVVVADSLSAPYEGDVAFVVQVSGYYDHVEVVSPPSRGTLQLDGLNGTYAPAAGAFGADGFELKASGPGGESQPVRFAVTIATPSAPMISGEGASVGYGDKATIELQVAGVFTVVEVVSQPAKGAAFVHGQTLTYTPAPGFSGSETVGVRAVGPGGASAVLQLRIDVAAPPAPSEPPPPVLVTPPPPANEPPAPTLIDRIAPALRDGVAVVDVVQALQGVDAIEILEGPSVGEVVIAIPSLQYTPPPAFTGQVVIKYRLTGAFGATAPATVTIQIDPPPPPPPVKVTAASVAAPATVELTEGVEGGPFSGASVISVWPLASGTAEILDARPRSAMRVGQVVGADNAAGAAPSEAGQAGTGYKLRFTPEAGFYGDVEVRYGLINKYGVMAEGAVKVAVDNRGDPSRDPQVTAIVNAQSQASVRFGTAQLTNVSRRLESRRNGSERAMMANVSNPSAGRDVVERDPSLVWAKADMARDGRSALPAAGTGRATAGDVSAPVVWVGGGLEIAAAKGSAAMASVDVETAGISMGADALVRSNVIVGGGIGYGRELADLRGGGDVDSRAASAFVYGSWQFGGGGFVDSSIGVASLSMETSRSNAAGEIIAGEREGSMLFASLGAGFSRGFGGIEVDASTRLDYVGAALDHYEESGPAGATLAISKQAIEHLAGRLGLKVSYATRGPGGLWRPFVRVEYAGDLRSAENALVSYAEGGEGIVYAVPLTSWTDGRLLGGLGVSWLADNGWRLSMELDGSIGPAGASSAIRIGGAGRF